MWLGGKAWLYLILFFVPISKSHEKIAAQIIVMILIWCIYFIDGKLLNERLGRAAALDEHGARSQLCVALTPQTQEINKRVKTFSQSRENIWIKLHICGLFFGALNLLLQTENEPPREKGRGGGREGEKGELMCCWRDRPITAFVDKE